MHIGCKNANEAVANSLCIGVICSTLRWTSQRPKSTSCLKQPVKSSIVIVVSLKDMNRLQYHGAGHEILSCMQSFRRVMQGFQLRSVSWVSSNEIANVNDDTKQLGSPIHEVESPIRLHDYIFAIFDALSRNSARIGFIPIVW
jgi:hypothetical protein